MIRVTFRLYRRTVWSCILMLWMSSVSAQAQSPRPAENADDLDGQATFLSANSFMLRLGEAPSDALIKALAQIGETQTLTIPANVKPEVALRAYCGGSFTNTYRDLVLGINPGFRLSEIPQVRTIKVTPCPKFQKNPTAVVATGDTLNTILVRTMGVDRDQLINQCNGSPGALTCKAGQATSKLNGGVDLKLPGALPVGATVTTPARTEWSTVLLKYDISPATAQAVVLKTASKGTSVETAYTPDLGLIQPLRSSDPAVKNSSCNATAFQAAQAWPFDESGLKRVLDRAIALATKRKSLTRTMVRIADTGATGLGTFFPAESLWANSDIEDGRVDGQGMGRYGYAVQARPTVEPLISDPNRLHGTEVADLALGGYEFRKNYQSIYQIIGVDFVNAFRVVGPATVEADPSALTSSIVMKPPRAEIINISLGGAGANEMFDSTLVSYANTNVLAVVAAGNANQDLNQHRFFPAWYGGSGQLENNMIVVGAAQPDGTRAPFSNYGAGRIDIIAPGCHLKLKTPNGDADDAGTSFAAPLVTFTAAVTHGLGVQALADVKKHILASADFTPALEGRDTILGARLNVVRAVESIYDDVLTDSAGKDVPGKWEHTDTIGLCKGEDKIDTRTILRVDVLKGADKTSKLRILIDDDQHGIAKRICDAGEGIALKPVDVATGNGDTGSIYSWDKVSAFIPARIHSP